MNLLHAALTYRRAGLAVIPLWNDKRKNPRISSYAEYCQRLPTETDITNWWGKWPNANIGLITGYWRNYVALDFDTQQEYEFWRNQLTATPSLGEYTWTVRTGRGYHVWFELATDPGKSRMYQHQDGGEVLLRAKGGYIIAPPSIHHSGQPYKTICNYLPLKIEQIDDVLPDWYEKTLQQTPHQKPLALAMPHTSIRIEDLIPPVGNADSKGVHKAHCPFHADKHPSAWVNIQQQRFGCNACWPGQWWDVVNVYAMMNGIDNGEAYKQLRGNDVIKTV